jgi:Sigma-70 region 2
VSYRILRDKSETEDIVQDVFLSIYLQQERFDPARGTIEVLYISEGMHVLEKPWDRIASQQGDVDWFCFWLKGEEDPDPAKAEQYARWRELRKLQQNQSNAPRN